MISKPIICTFPCLPFHVKQMGKKKSPGGFPASLTLFQVMAHAAWGGPPPFISVSCLISEQLPPTARKLEAGRGEDMEEKL